MDSCLLIVVWDKSNNLCSNFGKKMKWGKDSYVAHKKCTAY